VRHFWVDRIIAHEPGSSAVGVKTVALSEDLFEHHFPGNPVYPGIYLIEGLAQTAGYLLTESAGRGRVAVMASIDRVRFLDFVRPGQTVTLEVRIAHRSGEVAQVRGLASRDGARIAEAAITFRLVPIETLIPEVYRPLWAHSRRVLAGEFPGESS